MQAIAEGEVVVDRARDVECVAVLELAVVAIGGTDQDDHDRILRNRCSVPLHVLGDRAGQRRCRGLVPKDLLDRCGNELRVIDDGLPLVGMLGEQLAGPADQAGGRLVAS